MASFGIVAPSDPITGLDVFAAVSPLLGALIAVGGVVITVVSNNRRERERLKNEKENRLRDERIGAYRKLLATTATAHRDNDAVRAIAGTYWEISLLTESDGLADAAAEVRKEYAKTARIARQLLKNEKASSVTDSEKRAEYEQAATKAQAATARFLELAREELGVEGRSVGFRYLEDATPGEGPAGPEAGTSKP